METKQNIRKQIFRLRSQITEAQVHSDSLTILNSLAETNEYKNARRGALAPRRAWFLPFFS